MKKIFPLLLALAMVFTWTLSAQATLISRLGGLAYYDDDLDTTWLADANEGAGSAFDDKILTTDGRMFWQSAMDWAASLTVVVLPTGVLPTTTQGFGFNCPGSEMGHLFNAEGISTFAWAVLPEMYSHRVPLLSQSRNPLCYFF